MKKNLFIMAAALSLTVSACQQVDMESPMKAQVMTQDEFAAGLKLVDVSERIAGLKNTGVTRSTPLLDTKVDPIDTHVDGVSIVICSWKWHRKSRNCKSGFGICDFVWFPHLSKDLGNQELYDNSYESETNTDIVQCDNSSLIEFDVDGNPFMEVQLAKSIDVATPDSISTLVIDEDVVSDQADDLGRYFIMKKGSYCYNPSIGQNGGYHINMERTK